MMNTPAPSGSSQTPWGCSCGLAFSFLGWGGTQLNKGWAPGRCYCRCRGPGLPERRFAARQPSGVWGSCWGPMVLWWAGRGGWAGRGCAWPLGLGAAEEAGHLLGGRNGGTGPLLSQVPMSMLCLIVVGAALFDGRPASLGLHFRLWFSRFAGNGSP